MKVVSTARRAVAVRWIGCGINGQLQRGYSCRAQLATETHCYIQKKDTEKKHCYIHNKHIAEESHALIRDFWRCFASNENLIYIILHQWFSTWGRHPTGIMDQFSGRVQFFMHTAALHLLYWVLDGGRWVIVGYYNGSLYKKDWKPLYYTIKNFGLAASFLSSSD